MQINTGDQMSIKLRPYRTPIHKKPLVEEAVKDMLESRMIERSEFPIVVVDKKDGRHRFCVNFKKAECCLKTTDSAPSIDR